MGFIIMAVIKYYKNTDLGYATRKRYRDISSLTAYAQETQKSVLLGNEAFTTIKTSSSNLCQYVTIDGTRWFVVSYDYKNGGQVELELQRDVVGEFGVLNCFGKIERGYTDTFIKYRKELSLNQRLVGRTALKKRIVSPATTTTYGNYTVDNHNGEMWGILYFSKPSGGQHSVNIPILKTSPNVMNYPFIANNTKIYIEKSAISESVHFYAHLIQTGTANGNVDLGYIKATTKNDGSGFSTSIENVLLSNFVSNATAFEIRDANPLNVVQRALNDISISFSNNTLSGITKAQEYVITSDYIDYNNIVIKVTDENTDNYYSYTTNISNSYTNGSFSSTDLLNSVYRILTTYLSVHGSVSRLSNYIVAGSAIRYKALTYYYTNITNDVISGTINISIDQLFVDEPFFVCVMPLYDVEINGKNINKEVAFNCFNNIILATSGENGLLVDAQIYPYCPDLLSVNCTMIYTNQENNDDVEIDLFNIRSTTFDTNISVELPVNTDIKREYIEKQFSLVTPANTAKFDFNFYDYYNSGNTLDVIIKTSLKPFGIISSAVIQPQTDGTALKGVTYPSDLRGCTSSGSEFECSIASNAYETYARQNSNYQQMFELDKQELKKSHEIERQNEIANVAVNTITATAMGAIGGAAVAGGGKTGIVGAVAGGAAAGATVGTMMGLQLTKNDELRAYEEYLQQQRFNLDIGTIKNLPNSISRISSFNEIVMRDFYYVVETYDCTDKEKEIVDNFISNYAYSIGVYDLFSNYIKDTWFIRGALISSKLNTMLHNVMKTELQGGVYIYE